MLAGMDIIINTNHWTLGSNLYLLFSMGKPTLVSKLRCMKPYKISIDDVEVRFSHGHKKYRTEEAFAILNCSLVGLCAKVLLLSFIWRT